MTNQDSIQQKHLEAIEDNSNYLTPIDFIPNSASKLCLKVTLNTLENFEQWKIENGYMCDELLCCYFIKDGQYLKKLSPLELVQLFLTQKAK
jgi:hypothetical protein